MLASDIVGVELLLVFERLTPEITLVWMPRAAASA